MQTVARSGFPGSRPSRLGERVADLACFLALGRDWGNLDFLDFSPALVCDHRDGDTGLEHGILQPLLAGGSLYQVFPPFGGLERTILSVSKRVNQNCLCRIPGHS